MAQNFIELPWQKRCGKNQREVFCPGLFEHQARSFDKIQSRIAEDGNAYPLQSVRIDERCFVQEQVDEFTLRIEMHVDDPPREHIYDIAVHQLQRANAEQDKTQAL